MNQSTKTPFVRLAKREAMKPWKAWCIRIGSILLALIPGGILLAAIG